MRKSEEIRSLVDAGRENGETYSAIAKWYKISISGYKIPKTCKILYGGGQKQNISVHEARLMKQRNVIKSESSARELKEES